ncbi:hypothetical protein A9Q81_15620 [Gammaproteobacteria bacterium 42_54_T18]|nr:hypothetical protein A9Q81_15620 [Gammaproteobacteria bacterium 42_54_T18]
MVHQTQLLIKIPIWGLIVFCMNAASSYAQTYQKISLYVSADRTNARSSGKSIEQGLRTALSEVGYMLGNYPVTVKVLDHKGSTPRATKHLNQYSLDTSALALFSGLHSPPLLANLELIHKNQILILDPWAAATPITRYPHTPNWIFRLSIDDSKAGHVITKYAIEKAGVSKPALLLEQTGWGKANKKTMGAALRKLNLVPSGVTWFNWGISKERAIANLQKIKREGADSIFLVANSTEGKVIVTAMKSLSPENRLPIFSHWGITGGDFPEIITHSIRKNISLNFIQTQFSFLNPLDEFQQKVFDQARKLFPDTIKKPIDIKAPTGFIHTYDLTKILIAAFSQASKNDLITGDIISDRKTIRTTLENIRTPIRGLIKTYKQPFSEYSKSDQDAHEALDINDFSMAYYGKLNGIRLHAN